MWRGLFLETAGVQEQSLWLPEMQGHLANIWIGRHHATMDVETQVPWTLECLCRQCLYNSFNIL